MDIIGTALQDYLKHGAASPLTTSSSLDQTDTLPLPYLFRSFDAMPELEQKALAHCQGRILDIGSGAGSHGLYLQQQGKDVTVLDRSPGAIRTCKARGLEKAVCTDILSFQKGPFDTLLLLMNGIGLVGRLQEIGRYLDHFKKLTVPGGQILLDSSDIIYMYPEDGDGGHWIPQQPAYYGEVEYTMAYKGIQGKPFHWLYIDFNTLKRAAQFHGMSCHLVQEGDHYDYLAKLTVP